MLLFQGGSMASDATKEDAGLLLQLYGLRGEKLLRRACDFVQNGCRFKNYDDFQKRYPDGSKKRAYVRMVLGYWDMACTFVVKGLINEELFNSTNSEHVGVWFKFEALAEAWRKELKAPDFLRSLETVAGRHPAAGALRKAGKGKAPGKAEAAARRVEPSSVEGSTQEVATVA